MKEFNMKRVKRYYSLVFLAALMVMVFYAIPMTAGAQMHQLPLSISGTVTSNGVGKAGVTVALSVAAAAAPVATKTTITDASGRYMLTGVLETSYTVSPSLTGFTFTPALQTVTVSGADKVGVNFTASQIIMRTPPR
jgi:hypothetical protein